MRAATQKKAVGGGRLWLGFWALCALFFCVHSVHAAAQYADDFAACPEHFWQGKAPPIAQTSEPIFELCFYGFASLYSGQSKTPLYVAHHLSAKDVRLARQLKREDSFRAESRVPEAYRSTLGDYRGSGYDRGHLAPNGDMFDKQAQYDSFSLANIAPQNREHNRGVWRQIESHTRSLALEYGEAYIVTGVAFYDQNAKAGEVLVPTHWYKAVYLPSENTAAVYYTQNSDQGEYDVISVDELRKRTGVLVFASADPKFDASPFRLERDAEPERQATSFWYWLGRIARALWEILR